MKNLGASFDSDSFHFAPTQPSLQCDLLSLQTKLNFQFVSIPIWSTLA